MGQRRSRILIASAAAAMVLSACTDGDAIRVEDANSVVIDTGDQSRILGEISLGMGGFLGGAPSEPEPAGPIVVYIFKDIPEDYQQELADTGVELENNAAYLWPEDVGLHLEGLRQVQFIRKINPAWSDEKLAESFGVELDDQQQD